MKFAQFKLNSDAEKVHWWFVGRRRIVEYLVKEALPRTNDAVVVDVGCGTGATVASLSRHFNCIGIDPSQEAINLAKKRFPDVNLIQGLAPDDLGDWANRANLFLLADVLEHIPRDRELFSQLVKKARPGAFFLITVPADESLWSPHDDSHGHCRRYDKEKLMKLWNDLPVSTVMVSYFNSRLYPIVKLIRKINRWRGKTTGWANTDVAVRNRLVNWLLTLCFSGERRLLSQLLNGKRKKGYTHGVSLIALLQRTSERINLRNKSIQGGADPMSIPEWTNWEKRKMRVPSSTKKFKGMDCVIVIPCYNEAKRLDTSEFEHFARSHGQEGPRFLLVDDGSTDNTVELLLGLHSWQPKHFAVYHLRKNCGKAEAVRKGMLKALESGARYVGYWDADLATPLNDIPNFYRKLEHNPRLQVVTGSRVRLLGRSIDRRPLRHYMGRLFATIAGIVLGVPFYDTQCGAKLFRVSPEIHELFNKPWHTNWTFDVELFARYIANHRTLEAGGLDKIVYELPLFQWRDVWGSKVKATDFVRSLYELSLIWWKYNRFKKTAVAASPLVQQTEMSKQGTPSSPHKKAA